MLAYCAKIIIVLIDFQGNTVITMMIFRQLQNRLPAAITRRLVMITGARQTGKTTLARRLYSNLRYVSLDELEERARLHALPTRAWGGTVGAAILDEAQKEPSIFEKVKFAYDQGDIDFSVLLGSSQIVMLQRIRETLAGRVFIYELWPLMLNELVGGQAPARQPILADLLASSIQADDLLATYAPVLLGDDAHQRAHWLAHGLQWGGMPGLLDLTDSERRDWLHSYTNTYLERDLTDLARLDDLMPFRKFIRLAALRSGQLLSYADLARDADISPGTARNYLHYLQLSYQVFLLQPYAANPAKRLVKAPKLYWVDPGLWRYQTGNWGATDGHLLESYVVGECLKWLRMTGATAEPWFYRTHGGLEIDLLLTTPAGIWGIEVKTAAAIKAIQGTSLRRVAAEFGAAWRGGIVAYLGERIERLDANLWAVPVSRLLTG
jgi:predicted AAA+ superfamily ATPase